MTWKFKIRIHPAAFLYKSPDVPDLKATYKNVIFKTLTTVKPYLSTLFLIFSLLAMQQQALSQSSTKKNQTATQNQQKKTAENTKSTAQSSASSTPSKSTAKKAQPAPVSNIDRGLDFLKNKDVASAVKTLKSAKASVSRPDKKTCRKLIRASRKYDYIYFRKMKSVEQLRLRGDYVAAQTKMYSLRVNFLNIRRRKMSNRLGPVDTYLMQQHEKTVEAINKERIQAFTKKMETAQKMLTNNPGLAKELMAEAKKLMNPDEIKKYWEKSDTEADYSICLSKGDKAAAAGSHLDALQQYQEAQKKLNKPEVCSKIATTRAVLYTKYMRNGNSDYAAGQYVMAARSFNLAEQFAEDFTELNSRKQKIFPKLVEEGRRQATLGMHKAALEAFDLALEMCNSDEVKRLRDESYNFVQYDEWMKKAHEILETGDTYATEQAITTAQLYRKTDVDRELLARINAYQKYCKDADGWLKNGDIGYARNYVNAALAEVKNGNWAINLDAKIRDYHTNIKRAEELLPTDLVKAKGYIEAAGQICSTQKVKELRKKAGM